MQFVDFAELHNHQQGPQLVSMLIYNKENKQYLMLISAVSFRKITLGSKNAPETPQSPQSHTPPHECSHSTKAPEFKNLLNHFSNLMISFQKPPSNRYAFNLLLHLKF